MGSSEQAAEQQAPLHTTYPQVNPLKGILKQKSSKNKVVWWRMDSSVLAGSSLQKGEPWFGAGLSGIYLSYI